MTSKDGNEKGSLSRLPLDDVVNMGFKSSSGCGMLAPKLSRRMYVRGCGNV